MNTAENCFYYLFCTVIPPETHSMLLTSQALSANQHTLYPHITHRLIADWCIFSLPKSGGGRQLHTHTTILSTELISLCFIYEHAPSLPCTPFHYPIFCHFSASSHLFGLFVISFFVSLSRQLSLSEGLLTFIFISMPLSTSQPSL